MNKWIKRSAVAAALVVAGTGVAFAVLVALGQKKLERKVDIAVAAVPSRRDAASIERGRYLFSRAAAPTATRKRRRRPRDRRRRRPVRALAQHQPGTGSVVATYTRGRLGAHDPPWRQADGRPVMIMPSEDYNRLTDADVAALVAYLRSCRPRAPGATVRLPLPVRVLYAVGLFRDAAEKIDHDAAARPAPVPEGVTVEHGRLRRQRLHRLPRRRAVGGKIPGAPPDWPRRAGSLRPGRRSALSRPPQPFMAMLKTASAPTAARSAQ